MDAAQSTAERAGAPRRRPEPNAPGTPTRVAGRYLVVDLARGTARVVLDPPHRRGALPTQPWVLGARLVYPVGPATVPALAHLRAVATVQARAISKFTTVRTDWAGRTSVSWGDTNRTDAHVRAIAKAVRGAAQ